MRIISFSFLLRLNYGFVLFIFHVCCSQFAESSVIMLNNVKVELIFRICRCFFDLMYVCMYVVVYRVCLSSRQRSSLRGYLQRLGRH